MNFVSIVENALKEFMDDLYKSLDSLSSKERRYQPDPSAHHIDFAVWHMARVEDEWIQTFAKNTESIWEQQGWADKLGMPPEGSGYGFNAQQVISLPSFKIDDLLSYYGAVRKATLIYVAELKGKDLDSIPQPDKNPGYTIGRMLSHLIVEESQHVGQISYLRGIQRGLNR